MGSHSRKRKADGFDDRLHTDKARKGSQVDTKTTSESHKIIVGVDYGTTYTGVSYVATDKSDINDIAVISTWPGPNSDTETSNKRGFQAECGMKSYSWTKLLLDQRTAATKYNDAELEATSNIGILKFPKGKGATSVAADFLESVYKHTMSILAKQITEDALTITPLEFWFTMPAIWSDKAQSSTRKAAMQRGNGILICDCGGGTVDITTYKISAIYPKLAFEELCIGTGGKCGSSSIDRGFYKLISERFGNSFGDLLSKRKGPGSEFMRKFEQIKPDFGHADEDRVYELPLNMTIRKADPEYFDDDERLVKITTEDVQLLFDPVIEKIINLLKEQLKAASIEAGRQVIKHIILVGGFGDSEYLRQALSKEFASCDMKITVPEQPQAAIVKGAALRGLEGTRPTTRRCRRHYGFRWSTRFREGTDAEEDAYTSWYDGKKKKKTVKWVIDKGERVSPDTIASISLSQYWKAGKRLVTNMTLYSCGLDDAPGQPNHPRVRKVGTVKCNFSNIDSKLLRHGVCPNGDRFNSYQADVQVLLGANEGILTFQTVADGKVVGKADIDFGKD